MSEAFLVVQFACVVAPMFVAGLLIGHEVGTIRTERRECREGRHVQNCANLVTGDIECGRCHTVLVASEPSSVPPHVAKEWDNPEDSKYDEVFQRRLAETLERDKPILDRLAQEDGP